MNQSALTEDELAKLAMLPPLVGSAVAFSEKSGVVGTIKEMLALTNSVASGTEMYPGNQLIQMAVNRFDNESEEAETFRDRQIERLEDAGLSSVEAVRQHAVDEATAVNDLLAAKVANDEAQQYRQWVMEIATDVASAAKEGGFLGFGGTAISEAEQQTLDAVSAALGSDD